MRQPNTFRGALVALLALLAASPALADGTQTGIVAGFVVDPQNVRVPGATVHLSGAQLQREAVTDGEGRFRFPALVVGGYRIEAELLGLASPPREVVVYVDKISDAELQLRPADEAEPSAAVEETISVVAEAPLIDRYETQVGANVSYEFLEDLPVERFYQSVALMLPGVAGGDDGNPNTSGALRSSNLYLVDGVDTTDPNTGLFGLNLAYEAVDEVQVTTAAVPSQYGRTSGAVVNVVTRTGSRDYDGRARWVATNNAWNSERDYPAGEVQYLRPELAAANAAGDQLDSTVAVSLGGPAVPDHLYFFASWENAESSFLHPTVTGDAWDEDATVESGAFKLTWQLGSRHTLVAQHTFDSGELRAFAPFDRRPSENVLPELSTGGDASSDLVIDRPGDLYALERRAQDGRFSKLQWNAAFSQNLALTLNLSEQERELERAPYSSRGVTSEAPHLGIVFPEDQPPVVENARYFLFNGITEQGFERRPREQGNVALEWFKPAGALDHELHFGVDYQKTDSETQLNVAGRPGLDPFTGLEVAGQLFLDLPQCLDFGPDCAAFNPITGDFNPFVYLNFFALPERDTTEETVAVYASDTLSFSRWVLSLGVRYESVTGDDDFGRLVDDQDFSPRIALSYDPLGTGKVLFKAGWSRYFEPFLQQYIDFFLVPAPLTGYVEYLWAGQLGFDCSAESPSDLASACWFAFDIVPPVAIQAADPNVALERSSVDEVVVGFERQMGDHAGLSLTYVDRTWNDLWDDAPFISAAGPVSVVEQIPGARREYEAIQLLFQKRYADNWEMLASYTWSRAEGNLFEADGLATFADFTDVTDTNVVNRYGPAPYDRPHQASVYGTYHFPLERVDFSLATALRYRDGVPYQRETFESVPGLASGVRFLTPRGSERLSGVFQWDLAANLAVPITAEMDVELKAEVFNLTDENEQLGAIPLIDGGRFGLPRGLGDLQAPRSFRLSVGLRF